MMSEGLTKAFAIGIEGENPHQTDQGIPQKVMSQDELPWLGSSIDHPTEAKGFCRCCRKRRACREGLKQRDEALL